MILHLLRATEGMSDYYRDRVRHGGILSNKFISEFPI